jgi:hypothetical protein
MPSLSPQCFILFSGSVSPLSHFEVDKIALGCPRPLLTHLCRMSKPDTKYLVPDSCSLLSILYSLLCSSGSIPHFEHESELFRKNSETKTIPHEPSCRGENRYSGSNPNSGPKKIQFKSALFLKKHGTWNLRAWNNVSPHSFPDQSLN